MSRRAVTGKIVVGLALGLLLSGAAGCASIQGALNVPRPDAKIVGVKFQDLSFTSVNMLFDIEIQNPYSVPLPLVNIDYILASSGQSRRAGITGQGEMQGTVPANGTRTVAFPVQVIYLKLFNVVKGIRPGSEVPYEATLGLSVSPPVGGPLRLPIAKQGKLPVPAKPL